MHDKQQQKQQSQSRPWEYAATDDPYQTCRIRHPIFVTTGPEIPHHVFSQTYKFATSMSAGRNEKRPTWVLGLRASDASTQKMASRVLRGNIETLRADHKTFLQYQQQDRLQECSIQNIFQIAQETYGIEAGRPWTLWAYRCLWDTYPVALKSVRDVAAFLKSKMRELKADPTQETLAMQPSPLHGIGYEDGKMIMQFVVEVSPTWPKLFEMVDGGEYGEEEAEEDEEEAMIRDEMERLKLEYRSTAEHEAMAAGQKRFEAKEKALMRLIAKKEAETKSTTKREPTTKVSSSRREAQKSEEDRRETDRKDREKRRLDRAKQEETERRQAEKERREKEKDRLRRIEKERREKEKDRLRRIEKEEEEKKQQRIADRQIREKQRERWREEQLQKEKDKKEKFDRERTKDRLRERTDRRTGLVLSHGQVSVDKVTPAPPPFLAKFMGIQGKARY